MSDKKPENKNGLSELINKLWLPIAGFIGAVTLAYNFYKMWLGDRAIVTFFLTGGGLIVMIVALAWVGFSRKTSIRRAEGPFGRVTTEQIPAYPPIYRWAAWVGLFLIFIGMTCGACFLVQQSLVELSDQKIQATSQAQATQQSRQATEEKLIVVIAAFEGPEDVYGLRNQIIEDLNTDFANDAEIGIVIDDDVITLTEGSSYARELGKSYLADIIIWGWYRPTENPNITVHIENLTQEDLFPLEASTTLQPDTTLAELEAFTFQQQAGQETSALISFLAGFIDYRNKDFKIAIERFDRALGSLAASSQLVENQDDIYFYRGTAHYLTGNFQGAIEDYDATIQINPQYTRAYNNRGVVYNESEQHERAIEDFDQAIQIDPQLVDPYHNRGVSYDEMGEHERAIEDFTQAIQINPKFAMSYYSRGIAHAALGDYPSAIQDYDEAIKINPNYEKAYVNRGIAYDEMGERQSAIQDFTKAIQLDPQDSLAYYNRGYTYLLLGQYELAVEDFDQSILLNPAYPNAYYWRATGFQKLGKIAEAEADFKKYEELTGQKP